MYKRTNDQNPHLSFSLISVLRSRPSAEAKIAGSPEFSGINGTVRFYQTGVGVIVLSEVNGLPEPSGYCDFPVFGFHIHGGSACRGTAEDPFGETLTHYDPYGCDHPFHAGDLPPLFGNRGYSVSLVLTDRFSVDEIIGKTVVIHDMRDDFTTQPAGDSGRKIACGEIRKFK